MLLPFEDKNHKGNRLKKYRTGKKCITPRCLNPAGTAWSPFWCFECNVKRINGITEKLKEIEQSFMRKNVVN